MIYFPFVDLIEKAIKWVKEKGGLLYWVWQLTSGILIAISILIWAKQGFGDAKSLLLVGFFVWFGGLYPILQYEKYRKNKQKGGEK